MKKKLCYKCGCYNTIERINVKHKINTFQWKGYDNIHLKVNLFMEYCDVCSNTPMSLKDINNLDLALEESVAIDFLLKIRPKDFDYSNNDLIFYEFVPKTIYDDNFSVFAIIHNNKFEKDMYIKIAKKILESQDKMSLEDFCVLFKNELNNRLI